MNFYFSNKTTIYFNTREYCCKNEVCYCCGERTNLSVLYSRGAYLRTAKRCSVQRQLHTRKTNADIDDAVLIDAVLVAPSLRSLSWRSRFWS